MILLRNGRTDWRRHILAGFLFYGLSSYRLLLSNCNDVVIRLLFYRLYRYLRVDDQVVNLGLLYYSPTVSRNLNAHINKGLNNFSDLRHIRYERITKYKEFTYAFESLHYA